MASTSFEDLLQDLGGFGRFQFWIILALPGTKFNIGWSMLQMSYAGVIPDWVCVPSGAEFLDDGNQTLNTCSANGTSTNFTEMDCERYDYMGISKTVINEWDLVCDQSFVKKLVTSIQMAGVLVGAMTSGQLGDIFGRKKTIYGFVLLHIVLNIITAFSVNWEMFAAFRFLIGTCLGGVLVTSNPYPLEFMPSKWRTLPPIIPMWGMGSTLFALAAFFLEDWSYLHIACAVCGIPFLLPVFFIPESVRWLTVRGRLKEAKEVVEKIASINNKPVPAHTEKVLQAIYQQEKASRGGGKTYSYIDLFKGWQSIKVTCILCFFWYCMSVVYYGIYFAVSSLAGNLYLNIFLMASVEIPPILFTVYANNRFGRKRTTLVLFFLTFILSMGCLVANFAAPENVQGDIITGLAIAAKMTISTAWVVLQSWTTELYPTVTRTLGIGAVNTAARVGGIVAPYMVDLDSNFTLSFAMMCAILLADVFLCLLLPETKGTQLSDSMNTEIVMTETEQRGQETGVSTISQTKPSGEVKQRYKETELSL